jgi:prepilin-type N-terminal cleavage/methylation domain-containing protein
MNRRLVRTHAGRRPGFSVIELLVVVAIFGIMAALAVPSLSSASRGYRLAGDARALSHAVSLAKMRAAAAFTLVRLRADIGAGTFYVERLDTGVTPNVWTLDGGVQRLSPGVRFDFGGLTAPPPNTQATIQQSDACRDTADPPAAISSTSCLVFNSRGVPIHPTTRTPQGGGIYVTDGTAVYGAMVAVTGLSNLYWTPYVTPAAWQKQQ